MPRKFAVLRRGVSAALTLGLVLATGAAPAQAQFINPYAQLQQQALAQQQALTAGQAQQNSRANALADALSRDTAAPTRAYSREGTASAAEGGPALQAAAGRSEPRRDETPVPFGASLFEVGGAPLSDAVNPDYLIQPGDRIGLNVLGGASAPVDQSGSAGGVNPAAAAQLVTPSIPRATSSCPRSEPVHVGGVRATALQATIQQVAGRSYTNNVRFYAVLLTTHRIGVYVAGFVLRPGAMRAARPTRCSIT